MKRTYVLLFFILLSVSGFSQQITRCVTDEVMQQIEQQRPGYLARVKAVFNHAKQLAAMNESNRAAGDTIYRIQVVFHIVHTDSIENIPDSVIYSQMEVLNQIYRRKNPDTTKTRDIFKPVAADAGIEFYLATSDPSGNPTTGITRTVGNPTSFLGFNIFEENMKQNALGGKDPWPTDRYLNIWVCNVMNGFGVLGYSYPPDNAPNWPSGSTADSSKQGVVLHFPVVGANFSAPIDATVAMGKSCAHEIGHFLGLRHIWGDGDCTEDDGLDDTPNADAAHQQTCDTTSNTCVDSIIDYPDMIENYMDYSDDRCLNMFTLKQIGIMRAMLQTSRAGIASTYIETGIREATNDEVRVYPNPTTGLIKVDMKGVHANVSAEVLNQLGQTVAAVQKIPTSERFSIDLSGKPSGIYYLKLNADGQGLVKKVVIR